MRRVLIVSPHFPPTNAPDHQRVRMSLPFFRAHGWEPVVLAVDAAQVENPREPLLAETLPPDVPVHRVGAWPARWTRRVGLGNLAYRAWSRLRDTGDHLLRETRFDLVYFSTTQYVATALGARWRKKFGVPFVVDIQDPWRTDYYERPGAPRPPGGWKYRLARWQAARLEQRSWRDAAGFVSVNDAYLSQLCARYPWFAEKPSAVIPFGGSAADFEVARAHDELAPAFAHRPGEVHLVSVGAAGPIMRPTLLPFFEALAAFRNREASAAARLRFHFIGTSYAPAGRAEPSVAPLAAGCGVGDLVSEQPERVGYFTALKTMLAADAIVIPGSDDPSYSPSKLASCFLAEKPVLALAPANSSFEHMVRTLGFASIFRTPVASGDTVAADFLHRLLTTPNPPLPSTRQSALFAEQCGAEARTAQQCALFDRALAARPSR